MAVAFQKPIMASPARQLRLSVVARNSTAKLKVAAKNKPAPAKPTEKAQGASKDSNNLTVLAKIAELGLLSKVEELKLLSKLEEAGVLSKLEDAKLLSFAEKSGVLKVLADKGTPGALSTTGFLLLVGAVASAYTYGEAVPVDVAAVLLGVTGVAAIAAGSLLEKVQKL